MNSKKQLCGHLKSCIAAFLLHVVINRSSQIRFQEVAQAFQMLRFLNRILVPKGFSFTVVPLTAYLSDHGASYKAQAS